MDDRRAIKECISIREAARRSGYHPDTIRVFVRDGKLRASKPHGSWRIPVDAFNTFFGLDDAGADNPTS